MACAAPRRGHPPLGVRVGLPWLNRRWDSLPRVGGYAERVRKINRELVEAHIARMTQSPTQLGAALPPNLREQVANEALRERLK
jgi:hypothetical protein